MVMRLYFAKNRENKFLVNYYFGTINGDDTTPCGKFTLGCIKQSV